ncbi:MAG TPA: ABC transporter ATP-binding protein [Firmicutes bacterium]|nr:ABC transporter ATP-binding protein [Bacillota bacterium]
MNIARNIMLRYIRERWALYLFAIAVIIGSCFAQVQIPGVLESFTDELEQGRLLGRDVVRYAELLAVYAIIYVGLSWLAIFILYGQARKFEYHIRNHLFAHWESLSASYYTYHSVGDLMAYATNDVQTLRAALGGGIQNSVRALFTITLVVAMMAGSVDRQLALFSLLPLPFLSAAVTKIRPLIKKRSREVQHGFSMLAERTQESISGIRVVKAYAQEEQELRRFGQTADIIVKRTLSLTRVSALFTPLIQFFGAVSFLIALGMGGLRVINGELSLGTLVAFTSFLAMLVPPMRMIAQVIDVSQRAGAALGRLSDLLRIQPEVCDGDDLVHVSKIKGEIIIRNLSFTYPQSNTAIISNLNLRLMPGQTLGILGPTGSGKTTLANLLLRIYNPPRGTVFIDGHDVLDIPLKTLRRQIGYVPQDIFLFSASIGENIAFSVNKAQPEEVEQATKQAQIFDNIMNFPDQFDTVIGERGVTLSGGQKQRLAIARALIKNAPILILDDSLSSVDTETEAAILKSLRQVRKRQTTVIIAHRISALREAEVIIVLQDGQVVQKGTHDELVEQEGPYQDVYNLQKEGTATAVDVAVPPHVARGGRA